MSHSLEDKSLFVFLKGFYARRIKRIIPALGICVLFTLFLSVLIIPYPQSAIRTGISSILGVSNLYLLKQSTDYFAFSAKLNPFAQTWSLGVEEQFYFLYPIFFFLVVRFQDARKLLFSLVSFAIASYVLFLYFSFSSFNLAYFLPFTRFWEISLGAIAMLLHSNLSSLTPSFRSRLALASFCLAIVLMFIPSMSPVLSITLMGVLSFPLILFVRDNVFLSRLLNIKIVGFVGLISYSLYLWHWPVIVFARWTLGINKISAPIIIALIFVCALASYWLVETPFRRAKFSAAVSIVSGLPFVIANILAGFGLSLLSSYLFAFGEIANPNRFYKSHFSGFSNVSYGSLGLPDISSVQGGYRLIRGNLKDSMIVVIGDSHSGHYAQSFRELSNISGKSVLIAFIPGCHATSLLSKCVLQRDIFEWAQLEPTVESIVLTGYFSKFYQGRLSNQKDYSGPYFFDQSKFNEFTLAMSRRINTLSKLNKNIYILVDSHELFFDPLEFADPLRWTVANPEKLYVPSELVKRRNSQLRGFLSSLEDSTPNLNVVWMSDALCNASFCRAASDDGELFFQSADHFSPAATTVFVPRLLNAFLQ